MSNLMYTFFVLELCIGVLVGALVAQRMSPWSTGLIKAVLLGVVAVVELIVALELHHNRRPGNIILYTIAAFLVYFGLWGLCLIFTCIGYMLTYLILTWFDVEGWRFKIPALLALCAIYLIVAVIGGFMD
jgi:hypothetical protein